MWKMTDPINALLQPEVQHRLHFVHHGRVSIIQIRLTCLAWIREKINSLSQMSCVGIHLPIEVSNLIIQIIGFPIS